MLIPWKDQFVQNTAFDEDLFWEEINGTVAAVHDCLLRFKYEHLLDEMDHRNSHRMAYFLQSLYQSDFVLDAVKNNRKVNKDDEFWYLGAVDQANAETILRNLICKGRTCSLISFTIF